MEIAYLCSVIKIKGIKTMTAYEKALSASGKRQIEIDKLSDSFIKAIEETNDIYTFYTSVLYKVHSRLFLIVVAMLPFNRKVDVTDCDRFSFVSAIGNDDENNDVWVNAVEACRDSDLTDYIKLYLDNGETVDFYCNDDNIGQSILIDLYIAVREATE